MPATPPATGDQPDILARLLSLLPPWWPAGAVPVLDAALAAAAWCGSFAYGLIQYARSQARVATATGGWLDLIAYDYFARSFTRPPGWTDPQLRAQIAFRVLNPNGTRPGLIAGVKNLTGRTPIVVEPWNTGDTGAWSDGGFGNVAGTIGWDVAGSWGETDLPNQLFIHAFRPDGTGTAPVGAVASVEGWGNLTDIVASGGWDQGAIQWVDFAAVPGEVSDALIYATIDALMPAGTVAWVAITS